MKGGSILGWRMVAGVGVKVSGRNNAGVLARWRLESFYWMVIVE